MDFWWKSWEIFFRWKDLVSNTFWNILQVAISIWMFSKNIIPRRIRILIFFHLNLNFHQLWQRHIHVEFNVLRPNDSWIETSNQLHQHQQQFIAKYWFSPCYWYSLSMAAQAACYIRVIRNGDIGSAWHRKDRQIDVISNKFSNFWTSLTALDWNTESFPKR